MKTQTLELVNDRPGIFRVMPKNRVTVVSEDTPWAVIPDNYMNYSFEGMDEHLKPLFAALNRGGSTMSGKKKRSLVRRIVKGLLG